MTTGSMTFATAVRWRIRIGATCAVGGVLLIAVVSMGEAPRLSFLPGLLLGTALHLIEPWFVRRSPRWHRVVTFVPMVLYVFLLGSFAILAADSLLDDPVAAGLSLVGLWLLHVFVGPPEPTSFAYERLADRLTWAAAFQVSAMGFGTMGAALCTTRGLPVPVRFEPVVVGTALGAVVALVAAMLKVFTRVRRLATQLAANSRRMARCLDRLSFGTVADRPRLREAAENAWDALDLTLRSKIETGFHVSGTFVIPEEERNALESLVAEAIADTGGQPYKDAVARLNALHRACLKKIDTTV